LYCPYGYDDTDNGFTLAQSWRIYSGEFPYRDFISVRPPVSPLLHSIILFVFPDNLQFVLDRVFCFFLIAASSFFGAVTLCKLFNSNEFRINPYLLATVSFVFSVHHFPPMAWHTVDAIFFGSFGAYVLLNFSSVYSVAAGMILLFLSALSKQPFYLLPFAGVVLTALIHKEWKRPLMAAITLLLCIGSFVFILKRNEALSPFLALTVGSTKLDDLISAGLVNYVNTETRYIAVFFCLWVLIKKMLLKRNITLNAAVLPYIFLACIFLVPLQHYLNLFFSDKITDDYFFDENVAKYLFIISIISLAINFSLEKKWLAFSFLLTISWCASISWGYQTPVLFSLPLVTGFLFASYRYFGVKNIFYLSAYALLIGLITYFFAYQKPYRNPVRGVLNYNLSAVFPKMSHINISKKTYDKYIDFSTLVKKFGSNFKTLPGMPLSNYLTNTSSPTRLDWVFNAETGNENDKILDELKRKNVVVFLEKDQLSNIDSSDRKANSYVSFYIRNNWQKIDSTQYFEIYKK
jgi:hypothetical protein